jgi:hypothetical protein
MDYILIRGKCQSTGELFNDNLAKVLNKKILTRSVNYPAMLVQCGRAYQARILLRSLANDPRGKESPRMETSRASGNQYRYLPLNTERLLSIKSLTRLIDAYLQVVHKASWTGVLFLHKGSTFLCFCI